MRKLLPLAALILMGCKPIPDNRVVTITNGSQTVIRTEFPDSNYLYSVSHDGHTFVIVASASNAVGIIHHPSCPCLKKD